MNVFIILALVSAFCGAMANMLARKIMKYCGNTPEEYIPIHYSILTAMLLPLLPFFYQFKVTPFNLFILLILYTLDLFGNYFYLKSFAIQRVYKISTIVASGPVFSLLLYPLFYKPLQLTISRFDIIGIFVVVVGLMIVSYKHKDHNGEEDVAVEEYGIFYNIKLLKEEFVSSIKKKKVIYPLLAALFMGSSVYFMKFLFSSGAMNPYTYYTTRNMIFMLVFLFWLRPNFKEFLCETENIKWLFFRGLFVIGQWLLLLYAIQLGNPVVSKAIADTIPIFVVIMGYLIWKSKVRPRKIVGILVVIAGITLMTLF